MEKDTESYESHHSAYVTESNDVEHTKEIQKQYEERDQFKFAGFEKAITTTSPLPSTHIDVGSGTGWLLLKTSPYFQKVIGIEPSINAVEVARTLLKDHTNVEIIHSDMVDAFDTNMPTIPVFITTAVVFSHIKNYYVEEFLKRVNNLPKGSVLFFDERYDKNIQWKLWYIRRKFWWAKRLSNWDLTFYEINDSGYKSGIYGVCVGKDQVKNTYLPSFVENIVWTLQGIFYKAVDVLRTVWKLLKK